MLRVVKHLNFKMGESYFSYEGNFEPDGCTPRHTIAPHIFSEFPVCEFKFLLSKIDLNTKF